MSIFRKTMKALGFLAKMMNSRLNLILLKILRMHVFGKKSDRIMRVTLLRLLRELEKTKRRNCNSPIRCSIHC